MINMDNSSQICPQEGPQEKFLSSTADIGVYGGAAGGGKAQPLSSLVSTPFGFREMGSLKVGSLVNNPDGTVAKVIQIHPQGVKDIYKVTFSDGSSARCTADHLWLVSFASKKVKADRHYMDETPVRGRIATTVELMDYLRRYEDKGRKYWPTIPLSDPVIFTRPSKSKNRYPIDPYVLGVLLGDGCLSSNQVSFTSADEEIVNKMYDRLDYNITHIKSKTNPITYRVSDPGSKLRNVLKKLGLFGHLSYTKFIPDQYKYSPIEVRMELLRGLMDTDGTADEGGHVAFYSVSEMLAKDVKWLVESLGGRATIFSKQGKYKQDGEWIECATCYCLYVQHENVCDFFSLSRKRDRCVTGFNGGKSELRRRMIKIEHDGKEEA